MKTRLATAIIMLITAVMLVAMFACLMNVSHFLDEETEAGTVIGVVFLLIIMIPLSASWLILALINIIFGIILLVRRNNPQKLRKSLVALVVLTLVFGIIAVFDAFLVFDLFTQVAPEFSTVAMSTILLVIACFVMSIVCRKVTKKEAECRVICGDDLPRGEPDNNDPTQADPHSDNISDTDCD